MFLSHSSTPELAGLLLELNDAIEQLERKMDPLLSMVSSVLIWLFYCKWYNVHFSIKDDLDGMCLEMDWFLNLNYSF